MKFPLSRTRVAAMGLALAATLSVAGPLATSISAAAADCQFNLGFKTLHDLDATDVGECTGNQVYAANGDGQQPTTHGMMVWRKADNFTAFTDGFHTWVNGPSGVQMRLNSERFSWEAPANNATVAPAVYTSVVSTTPSSSLTTDFFNLLNSDRQENGEKPLALNSQLSDLAQQRAQGLLGTNGAPLNHYDTSGNLILREIMDGNHIPYITAGENLAENNYDPSQTVSVANTGLMHSPTHRANILNAGFSQVGIGLSGPDPNGRYYYVQLFLQS